MRKLDPTKLANLKTVDGLFDEKYGAEGTETRAEFDAESAAWYFGELMRERRKRLNMTQEDLAQKINAKRTYISRVERGEAADGGSPLHRRNPVHGDEYHGSHERMVCGFRDCQDQQRRNRHRRLRASHPLRRGGHVSR